MKSNFIASDEWDFLVHTSHAETQISFILHYAGELANVKQPGLTVIDAEEEEGEAAARSYTRAEERSGLGWGPTENNTIERGPTFPFTKAGRVWISEPSNTGMTWPLPVISRMLGAYL
ncbi:hypothetical protein FNV43_RR13626 [Rhamnella rubrinervis]|uniref:Uncharacterized protein n=1 Tax=Rhamnella rubrinervis TaxID=2594499 RepID=A0A8K0H1E1_9ROSA|nr:hypothetical protein FNV43_RR13626 [Rhamnella rubrinervis]